MDNYFWNTIWFKYHDVHKRSHRGGSSNIQQFKFSSHLGFGTVQPNKAQGLGKPQKSLLVARPLRPYPPPSSSSLVATFFLNLFFEL